MLTAQWRLIKQFHLLKHGTAKLNNEGFLQRIIPTGYHCDHDDGARRVPMLVQSSRAFNSRT